MVPKDHCALTQVENYRYIKYWKKWMAIYGICQYNKLNKNKLDAFFVFQQLKAKAETQFHTKLKSIQTDWGEVFRSMTSFLNTNGILHRVICPHTHYQNGVVNSHFIELGLTLLKQASLPLKLWEFAVTTTIFHINMLPTALLNFKVPFTIVS